MSDKRKLILASAEQLLLQEGAPNLSMQSVASHAGISKGSIYLYFKSKEELLIAVFEQQTDGLIDKLNAILTDPNLEPTQKLCAQIRFQYEDMQEYQHLFQALTQEEGLIYSQHLLVYYQEFRITWQRLQEAFILETYGEKILPWISDLAFTLDGMVSNYLSTLVIEEVELNLDKLVNWITSCLSAICEQLPVLAPSVVITKQTFPTLEEVQAKRREITKKQVISAFHTLEVKAHKIKLTEEQTTIVFHSLKLIDEQLHLNTLDHILIRALLAGINDIKGLKQERLLLAEKLGIA